MGDQPTWQPPHSGVPIPANMRRAAPPPLPANDLNDLAAAAAAKVVPDYAPPVEDAAKLSTARVWFVVDRPLGQRGPMSEKEVANLLAAGRVGHFALVWQHGWGSWQPILNHFHPPPQLRPRPSPSRKKGWLIAGAVLLGLFVIGKLLPDPPRTQQSQPLQNARPLAPSDGSTRDDPKVATPLMVALRLGKADVDELDAPHSLRALVYKRQATRFLFFCVKSRTDEARDDDWVLLGATDLRTGDELSRQDIIRRFGLRVSEQSSSVAPAQSPAPQASVDYSSGKTVHVHGYYRKDGTYVQPHDRRAPRR